MKQETVEIETRVPSTRDHVRADLLVAALNEKETRFLAVHGHQFCSQNPEASRNELGGGLGRPLRSAPRRRRGARGHSLGPAMTPRAATERTNGPVRVISCVQGPRE